MLGLGSSISRSGKVGPTIIRDGLVLKHDYNAGAVQPCSTGAADINADAAANEYIDVGAIPITTNDVTMSAWVYITSWNSYAAIFSNRHASDPYPGIALRCTNGAQSFESIIDDGGSSNTIVSGLKNSNQWYHLCAVMDRSGSQYLYVDGVLEVSSDIQDEALTLDHATTARIGRSKTTQWMGGYVCNVGYWNAALTQPQIKSIMLKDYASLSASEKEDLVSWWNLDTSYDANDTTIDNLVLDNHYGGGSEEGSELLVNGDFATGDLTAWAHQASGDGVVPAYVIVNGVSGVRIKSVSGGNSYIHQSVLVSGKFYNVSYTILENNNGSLAIEDNSSNPIPSTVGDHTLKYYFVDSDTALVLKRSSGVTDVVIANISVKQINGNPGTLA